MFTSCSQRYSHWMTREDLLCVIARAVRRSVTFLSEGQARGAADTVLRDLKSLGVRITRPRPAASSKSPEAPADRGNAGAQRPERALPSKPLSD